MTAAARAINVTQSAASAAIAALETRHAVKLFHRVGRRIVLTDAGRVFLEEARAVLARSKAAEIALDDLSGLKRGGLRIIASQTIAAYWLPHILASYRARYPYLTVDLAIGNTGQAAAQVKDGGAELAIVEGQIDDPVLDQWPIGKDRLLVVQAEPQFSQPDVKMLASARWVMREPGSGTRSTFDQAMRRIGIDPQKLDVAMVLPSNESVRTAVEAGAGVAALSALVVAPALAADTIHSLQFDLGVRSFYGLCHKERYRTHAVDALLDLIAERSRPQPDA